MKDLNSAFQTLTGKAATDEQLQALYRVKETIGIRDHDALWEVMIALQYHLHLYKEVPKNIQNRSNEITQRLEDTSTKVCNDFEQACLAAARENLTLIQKRTKEFEAQSQKNITAGARDAVLGVARDVSTKEKSKWITIAATTCGIASLALVGLGFWLGNMKGYEDAVNAKVKYHWSGTKSGQEAFQLYKAGSIHALATCSVKGWKEKGDMCYPAAVEEGKVFYNYGYNLRE
jgi:hypothetical protein